MTDSYTVVLGSEVWCDSCRPKIKLVVDRAVCLLEATTEELFPCPFLLEASCMSSVSLHLSDLCFCCLLLYSDSDKEPVVTLGTHLSNQGV